MLEPDNAWIGRIEVPSEAHRGIVDEEERHRFGGGGAFTGISAAWAVAAGRGRDKCRERSRFAIDFRLLFFITAPCQFMVVPCATSPLKKL